MKHGRILCAILVFALLLTGSALASGEPGHPEYAQENKTAQKGAIVLTGSSLCEWFPIDEILAETGDDFVIYNRGYGGYVMTQLMEVLDTAVIDLAPSAVFINIGTNDIDRLTEEYTIEDMMANYGAILDRIKTEVPGCQIYVLAYYPCTPNTGTGRIQRTLEQILEVNRHVEAMAKEHGCIYLDINEPLQDETGHLKDEYAADSIHLTDEAYRVIYQSLRPYFEAVSQGASGEASNEASGAAFASGEPSGEAPGASGEAAAGATNTETITLVPEELDELIIGPEGYEFTTDLYVGKLEIDDQAELTAEYPVIVFFEESDSVENGAQKGNVQFVSDYDEVIAIVHTNDVHGHIEVEPYVKGFADALKASGDYSLVLTISAGDIYGGGEAVAGSYNGEFIPAIMDPIYDVIAPGNNDFGSTGVARQNILLSRLYEHTQTLFANAKTQDGGLTLAEYAVNYEPIVGVELFDELYEKVSVTADGSLDLSALEMTDLEGNTAAYQPTAVFTTENGTQVGLFGLCTTGGALAVDLDSLGSITTAQECVNALVSGGAEVVVGVGHTGWMGDGATTASSNDTNSWQLANRVTGLDAFVDAHTHSIIHYGQGALVGEDPTLVNQAESFGYCIGAVYLYVKDGEVIAVDGNVIKDMSDITPDADVQALVDLAMARVKEDFGKPIAQTPYFLNGERLAAGNEGGSVRGNETNLGDLVTDVILAAASEKMGVDYDFCVYPGYWIRSSVEAGDITLESIQGVFANPTVLYYDTYTGEQILSLVTKGLTSVYPDGEGSTFNHYAGIRVTYTYNNGVGTPVTIEVGDTPVYDASSGGLLVDDSWTCEGVLTMTGGEIDSYTGDMANWICHDKTEVHELVSDWFERHTADDYTIHPNTVAPDGRIVEIEG